MIPEGKPFSPVEDVPILEGKHVFITGGTSGIGRACLLSLAARKPARILFTGRNRDHANSLVQEVLELSPETAMGFIPLDHASTTSVRDAITKVLRSGLDRLDMLICNAGIMACSPLRTADGYDIQFASNFVGNSFIVHMLLPTLLKTRDQYQTDVRILMQTSEAYMLHPPGGIDWTNVKINVKAGAKPTFAWSQLLPWGGEWMRFAESQLANLLFASELARRYPQITSVAVMPGSMSDTKLIRTRSWMNRLLIRTVEPVRPADAGAQSLVWAAAGQKYEIVNGGYYQAVGIEGLHVRMSRDRQLAERLWHWSEQELHKCVEKSVK